MQTLQEPTDRTTVRTETLSLGRKGPNRRWVAIGGSILLLVVAVTIVVIMRIKSAAAVTYDATPVVRTDVVQSVTATGTLDPQNTVAIGTQASGTIAQINVDFNSHVHRGDILARLDPTTAQAALDQANASLAQAQNQANAAQATAGGGSSTIAVADANARAAQDTAQAAASTARLSGAAIASADASITKAQSTLALATQTVARDRQLFAQGYIAQSQLDADQSAVVGAQAGVAAAQTAAQQARIQATASASQALASRASSDASQAQTGSAAAQAGSLLASAAASRAAIGISAAQAQQARLNLARTIITSPVDGTIVARNVSVGQTVAASFSTPTLFSIAQNLNKMEVDLSVGEPDIGNVRPGEAVEFTVLAYPARTFRGTVSQVRINPTTTANVVTYTTVVLVDNRDGRLLPGMTANASIHVAKATSALTVPLAALSYAPPSGAVHTHRKRSGRTPATKRSGSPWGPTAGAAASYASGGSTGRIYVLRGTDLRPVRVRVVLVNGTQAAVEPLRGKLAAGDRVVTGDSSSVQQKTSTHVGGAKNPFGKSPSGRVLR